jgi:hypothetical protein
MMTEKLLKDPFPLLFISLTNDEVICWGVFSRERGP